MIKELKCIMLVDDNPSDIFFHEREINKIDKEINVVTKSSAFEGLEYLKLNKAEGEHPDLIFLDINMPGMNGWEFLEAYSKLEKDLQSKTIIIMLTTSENSNDATKAKSWNFVSEYITKALTKKLMEGIVIKHFS